MSHANRCADKGVANEGWAPQNRQPRSERLPAAPWRSTPRSPPVQILRSALGDE